MRSMPDPQTLSAADRDRVDEILSRYREDVLSAMQAAIDRADIGHASFMRYHLGWQDAAGQAIPAVGGKMLRPALCLVCCEAVGGDRQRAMPAAAALELVHNFTLIHDDIEDNSATRHGRDTLWRVAGIAQAINAGDGMFVLAQRTLLDIATAGVDAERVLQASRLLNDACTALCEGQYADIGFETRDDVSQRDYEAMIAGKTSALLGASAAIGALAGGADDRTVAALGECGRLLGLAFQVQDDVLGIWGVAAVTGKPVADDIRSRKKSFPIVWAFEHAPADVSARLRQIYRAPTVTEDDVDEALVLLAEAGAQEAAASEAARWADRALATLDPLDLAPERKRDLEALGNFFVHREA